MKTMHMLVVHFLLFLMPWISTFQKSTYRYPEGKHYFINLISEDIKIITRTNKIKLCQQIINLCLHVINVMSKHWRLVKLLMLN